MKELIVISAPTLLKNEATLINALFDEGLDLFHLRKPEISLNDLLRFVDDIDYRYYERIVFPASTFMDYLPVSDISKKIHFFEYLRNETDRLVFDKLQQEGRILSTSIHEIETYKNLPASFDYTFFSPVFDSISKQGYKAMGKEQLNIANIKRDIKLIALGGINRFNCLKALEYGFDGIALLGAIWQDDSPVKAFRDIRNVVLRGL